MRRLVIVSNRLPVSIERRRGKFVFQPSMGGLATGLGEAKGDIVKTINSLDDREAKGDDKIFK
jgi:trehalose-6-phosphate synthase